MKAQRIEQLVWVLIYGGLVSLSLGWFVTPQRGPWGELMITGGLVATVAGVVLIVVRARMKDQSKP
jgi:F0F1-type ATP synthase assembly protein I